MEWRVTLTSKRGGGNSIIAKQSFSFSWKWRQSSGDKNFTKNVICWHSIDPSGKYENAHLQDIPNQILEYNLAMNQDVDGSSSDNSLNGRTDGRTGVTTIYLSVQQHNITSVIDAKLLKPSKSLLLSHDLDLNFACTSTCLTLDDNFKSSFSYICYDWCLHIHGRIQQRDVV